MELINQIHDYLIIGDNNTLYSKMNLIFSRWLVSFVSLDVALGAKPINVHASLKEALSWLINSPRLSNEQVDLCINPATSALH